jgi:hypothetical protein
MALKVSKMARSSLPLLLEHVTLYVYIYIYIYQQVLNLVYELYEDSTDQSKHLSVVKDYTFMYVSNVCIKLFL